MTCIILSALIQGNITPLQEQRPVELVENSIPAANSYDEVSSYMIADDPMEAIAFWGDELWGILHSNQSIAEISSVTGDTIRYLPDVGITPSGMAVSEEFIYLSGRDGSGNGTVYSINKTTGAIVDSFDVFGEDCYAFGIEYDNGYLWMDQTNYSRSEFNLLKVNASTGAVVANYSSPFPIAAGPQLNGVVYCVSYDTNEILGFNQDTGQIVCNFSFPVVTLGDWGSSQHRGNLVLSNFLSTNFYYIRTQYSTGETVFTIDLEDRDPDAFRVANNGTHLFIRPSYTSAIKILEIGTGNEVGEISLSFIPLGITYYDNYLWVSDADSPYAIHKMETDGTEIASFSLGLTSNQWLFDLAHDGTYLWAILVNRTLVKIDISSQSIVEYIEIGIQFNSIAYSAAEGKIFGNTYNDGDAIFQFDPETKEMDFTKTISVNMKYMFGLSIWQDKFIVLGNLNGRSTLAYIQNNHDSNVTGDIPSDDDSAGDETPMLFGFNALYVVGAGAGVGLLLGLIFGSVLSRKKK
ncbi:MAG: hypothetical protein E4G98_00130 [Promethearchaeota archaeon]|nr:MAG: hypothetical protein E4G98_00130 [Candidatus Lokiarchaeota archaeon]